MGDRNGDEGWESRKREQALSGVGEYWHEAARRERRAKNELEVMTLCVFVRVCEYEQFHGERRRTGKGINKPLYESP